MELQEYETLLEAVKGAQGPVQAVGTLDSQKVHMIHCLGVDGGFPWKLVITYDDQRAREICDDFASFTGSVWLYPAKDLLFYSADIHGNLITRQRISVLRHLMEDEGGVVVTTIDGLMDHLLPLAFLKSHSLTVEDGQVMELDRWKEKLTALGYERTGQVDAMGQFSVRGGILDIFPLTEETPVRIELWGDTVDSIRTFDLESQRSVESLDRVVIYPASETVLTAAQLNRGLELLEREAEGYKKALKEQHRIEEGSRIEKIIRELSDGIREGWKRGGLDAYIPYFCEETVSFLEYFPKGDTLICLDEPVRLKDRGEVIETEFRESMAHRLENGYLLPGQTELLYPSAGIMSMIQGPYSVFLSGLDQKVPGLKINRKFSFDVKNVNSYENSFEMLIHDLTRWKKEGYRVALLSASRTRASRLAGDLREYDLRAYCPDGNGDEEQRRIQPGEIMVTYGNLHRGFEYPLLKFVFITEGDMFGLQKKKRKRRKTSYQGRSIQSFSELTVGDYVVHEDHGLGIYRGIEKVERDRVIKDYIKIEYGDGGSLYLPATRLESIQKYAGSDAKKPKLNRLGGSEWVKTRTRVKGAVQEIAKDLVKLYAARQERAGYQYGSDTVWQREFEELFPYEETEDQLDAIEAVKEDMESSRIMDRLICGDVGYGKTEIALRAAFKAVQDSKQVVYLVPTTILAQQHYNTFVQRMKDFPVRVDMLSRFCTPAQQKKTLGSAEGYDGHCDRDPQGAFKGSEVQGSGTSYH